jgi:ABC-type Zn uptake system ZnuABC Zn-binding protein ZnuA
MILDKWGARIVALALCATFGCAHAGTNSPLPAASTRPIVVASTSTLASLVKAVADDMADVRALVPIGASPETYEPAPRDVLALEQAAIVVENGAGLETWLTRLIGNASSHARIVVLSDALPAAVAHPNGASGFVNPHFWLDPLYAGIYVRTIADALAAIDPQHATEYRANQTVELRRLKELDASIRRRIATIPPGNRAMITDHDAWYYFDKRYGIEDVGAIEQSPGKEPSAAYLAALIAKAKARHVVAVFAEPEFSPKLAKELADNAGIKTVTDLYDDSLGTAPQLRTYEGMMRHDVDTIVKALKP